MSTRRLPEISLQLQEARRRDPDAYRTIAAAARIPVARVKAVAYGETPTATEKEVLMRLARG
jgi:hypothetical protein